MVEGESEILGERTKCHFVHCKSQVICKTKVLVDLHV